MSEGKYKFIAVIATLLSIGSIAATGYLYYKGISSSKQIEILSADDQNVTNRLWSLEKNFNASNADSNEQLSHLESSVSSLYTKLDQLSSNRGQIIRAEISYFINLSSQSLLVYHDVATALQLLTYANNYIEAANNPIFNKLQYAISHDITQLQQLPRIDKIAISAKLDVINQRLNSVSFINQNINPVSGAESATNVWGKFVYNLKNTLFSFVKISKTNTNGAILLPEEEYLVRSQVKLELLNARFSLLSNDNANWNSSLTAAKQSIHNYFADNATSAILITQIDELKSLNIDVPDNSLDETMKALFAINIGE